MGPELTAFMFEGKIRQLEATIVEERKMKRMEALISGKEKPSIGRYIEGSRDGKFQMGLDFAYGFVNQDGSINTENKYYQMFAKAIEKMLLSAAPSKEESDKRGRMIA